MSIKKHSTERSETFRSTMLRWGLNFFPAYFSTGASVTFLAGDFQEVHLKIPLNWRTRDHVGEVFKGIQYAAVDPVYPMMLRYHLGSDYLVKEEDANVRYLEPCTAGLRTKFEITDDELERIKTELNHHDSVIRVYKMDLENKHGTVCTEVEKTLAIRETE